MTEMMAKWDVKVLGGLGGALLALAAVFLWRDLHMPVEALLILAAVATLALGFLAVPRGGLLIFPIAVLATSVTGGLWYAATKQPLLLVGLALTFIASVIMLPRSLRRGDTQLERIRDVLVWFGLTAATIATSWTFYFHFLTLGVAEDHIARRLVLTLGWLVIGVVLVFLGRKRGAPVIRDAGFCFVAISVGKTLLYDTAHLDGSLRVAGLAAAGALMLGTAWLSARSTPATPRSS
ncbi:MULTISPECIES: DUF2339 domain-containing protein [Myxococcus]|nr:MULTISPECIES: DUF2339 domain-containing protein [Myxococcus]NTX04761.1 DUF2339 domain-containing protein [Myxococcus sp. CA040A]NTX15106.1 DUF2339 domain-containing protein [Myxococcus sp. CA056]NTX36107.1 DUF2339 domain-containing protein [Myxococcus sp. CA033]